MHKYIATFTQFQLSLWHSSIDMCCGSSVKRNSYTNTLYLSLANICWHSSTANWSINVQLTPVIFLYYFTKSTNWSNSSHKWQIIWRSQSKWISSCPNAVVPLYWHALITTVSCCAMAADYFVVNLGPRLSGLRS